MHLPIQFALTYPERTTNQWPRVDLAKVGTFNFIKPDNTKFPCLELAYVAGKKGGTLPAVLNAANEEVVGLFLKGKIGFMDIPRLIKETMDKHSVIDNPSLEQILEADKWARSCVSAS
jgi:1-deoxy-D-xylulose-5-phosphate reductoisomerase